MAHVPEKPTQYVCENCRITHAGTPVHESAGEHSFEPPSMCGGCAETEFVEFTEWVRHHE